VNYSKATADHARILAAYLIHRRSGERRGYQVDETVIRRDGQSLYALSFWISSRER
jgi:hypothetical protein